MAATGSNLSFAILLTLIAGLSTGVGSVLALLQRRPNKTFLSLGLGFSAGVMIYISFVELLATAREGLAKSFGAERGAWIVAAGFFCGMGLIALIDKAIPSIENPHDAKDEEQASAHPSGKLMRMGLVTALAIGIHNFPEGMATFMSAMTDPKHGLPVTVAIAIHNIPEGIAVSVPIYFATGSRRKAFTWSFLSGLSEPIGAIVGYTALRSVLTESTTGIVQAAVAGIMVFISLDQLVPNAHQYGKGHVPMYGLVAGMAVMAGTLLIIG